MRNTNRDLKELAMSRGVYLYEIACKLGITAEALNRCFRKPLTNTQRAEIVKIIDEIAAENAANA